MKISKVTYTVVVVCSSTLILLFTGCGNRFREKKINVNLIFGQPQDTFKVFINDQFRASRILNKELPAELFHPRYRMFQFSTSEERLTFRFKLNSLDTSFYIYPKDLEEIYIGSTINRSIYVALNGKNYRLPIGCANDY